MLLLGILTAVWVFALIIIAEAFLYDGAVVVARDGTRRERKKSSKTIFEKVEGQTVTQAIIIGLSVGAISCLAPKTTPIIALVFAVAMLVALGWLLSWWKKDGSTWKEMIPFILLAITFTTVLGQATSIIAARFRGTFLGSFLSIVPLLAVIISVGYIIVSMLFFQYETTKNVANKNEAKKGGYARVAGVILMILVIVLVLATLWPTFRTVSRDGFNLDSQMFGLNLSNFTFKNPFSKDGSNLGANPDDETSELTLSTPVVAKESDWYHFYNTEVLHDNDKNNDYNFGPNPYNKGEVASYYDASFRNRMRLDPALAAADMAWLDAIVGTRYLGTFYEECKGEWASTINTAKEGFMNDQSVYYKTLEAYFSFLDSAKSVELRYVDAGLDDQMYMNGYTVDGVPDVIVMKTLDHDGWFLTYVFVIKDQKFEVSYRIDCGYQPTNVEKVMGIKPQSKPTPTPTPTPGPGPGPDPTPTPTPPGPDPTPTPTPTPPPDPTPTPTPTDPIKDPTQGTDVGGNDDPGPGPDTNTGVGSDTSAADQPTNSDHMDHEEYHDIMDNLADINENQQVGGDPNTPSVQPDPGAHVDNNGDQGTGNGGIDVPTPVSEPVHIESPSGEQTSISDDPPGEQWDGPPD